MKFDQLNKLEIEDYFEPMAISVDDKNRRRELADLLTDAFLYFFAVYEVHSAHNGMLEKVLYEQLLADRISEAVSKVAGIDGEMSQHIRTLAKEVVDTTERQVKTEPPYIYNITPKSNSFSISTNLEESLDFPRTSSDSHVQEGDGDENENYWLSYKRASNIANSEANTFLNYTDYLDAKDKGYTKKTWLTMLDNKVRDSHEEVEGQTVGIDEFFQVGNSQMKFPHDWESAPDPKEVINCRCAVEYK